MLKVGIVVSNRVSGEWTKCCGIQEGLLKNLWAQNSSLPESFVTPGAQKHFQDGIRMKREGSTWGTTGALLFGRFKLSN